MSVEKEKYKMKKLLLGLVLGIPLVAFASENYVVNGVEEPQWKDFAPVSYVDVKQPRGLGKFNDTAAYWYKRKVEFQNGILKCRDVEAADERVDCYQTLKYKQYAKNSDYNARLEDMDNEQRLPQNMQNPTSNMLQLDNAMNTFMNMQANEFR